MRFASFLSGGFIPVIVVNPPERKLAKHTSVQCRVYSQKFCLLQRWVNSTLAAFENLPFSICDPLQDIELTFFCFFFRTKSEYWIFLLAGNSADWMLLPFFASSIMQLVKIGANHPYCFCCECETKVAFLLTFSAM